MDHAKLLQGSSSQPDFSSTFDTAYNILDHTTFYQGVVIALAQHRLENHTLTGEVPGQPPPLTTPQRATPSFSPPSQYPLGKFLITLNFTLYPEWELPG